MREQAFDAEPPAQHRSSKSGQAEHDRRYQECGADHDGDEFWNSVSQTLMRTMHEGRLYEIDAEALRAVIEGEREPDRYPAQVVEGNVLWMVDRAAASRS